MKVKVAALLLDILVGRYRVKERGFKSANTEVPNPIPVLPRHPTDFFPVPCSEKPSCLALAKYVLIKGKSWLKGKSS